MYVDTITKKVGDKVYTHYLIRDSHLENGKVKHRTIANISKCSPEEIQAIKLALKYKGNISDILTDKNEIVSKQGLSIGSVYTLNRVAQDLSIVKALGNSDMAKLSLWMILARIIEPGSRMANVRLAQRHAAVSILNLPDFNEDVLYRAMDWIESHQRIIENRLFNSRYREKKLVLYLYDVTSS